MAHNHKIQWLKPRSICSGPTAVLTPPQLTYQIANFSSTLKRFFCERRRAIPLSHRTDETWPCTPSDEIYTVGRAMLVISNFDLPQLVCFLTNHGQAACSPYIIPQSSSHAANGSKERRVRSGSGSFLLRLEFLISFLGQEFLGLISFSFRSFLKSFSFFPVWVSVIRFCFPRSL